MPGPRRHQQWQILYNNDGQCLQVDYTPAEVSSTKVTCAPQLSFEALLATKMHPMKSRINGLLPRNSSQTGSIFFILLLWVFNSFLIISEDTNVFPTMTLKQKWKVILTEYRPDSGYLVDWASKAGDEDPERLLWGKLEKAIKMQWIKIWGEGIIGSLGLADTNYYIE